ncbi:hypothetical protein GTA62_18780 [Roseobacter sp. HKCCD9010]|uniref:hypothetical protein n=1 Tax=unclassified Roseobacter TaxID=196798 RepID=UPI0014925EC5|nr:MULTISPECIES: hypothetical protein [unclassified Roseobacter]MBF9052033.1 hypothetical protein [Rhodobacterales bacterium HKCCD4356]NNV13957.1 hypothetical protein [Roseobacter sp. HKCCD7357]NNV18198.1 hypothetical protein [Roseobacter sp. HKCCD8768]NNV27658.1 hypothetical protein [Roseobacter sp. HKCCD8192]NNV31970.1 hypothetical protein [Roseobacter sp. HKCCD9061]
MVEAKGYVATDGAFVATEPITALPDGEIDLNSFRQSALTSAVKAARNSCSRLFGMLDQTLDAQDALPKWARENMSAPMFRRIENILMQARAHREANVGANVDALIDCLASPETAGAFQSLLPGVLGFAPLNYANGYASWMEREHP